MTYNMTRQHTMFRHIASKRLLFLVLLLTAAGGVKAQTEISSLSQITDPAGNYRLSTDISGSAGLDITFTGTLDGGNHTISGLSSALFSTIDGGIVKNVILDNVIISGSTNVGAICNEATGDTRIYNCGVLATNSTVEKDANGYDHISSCSSSVSGTGYVGGLVGLLDGSSRVINCFSYADVSGGSHVGGIVGYNNVATTANNLQTMVMNCMFYGEVSGSSISPIYNGQIITNVGNSGVSNFNYFRLEASYVQPTGVTYNCALGAEDRFLQRFEFYRHLLNSHRELAAWWASTSTTTVTKNEIMKWVMEPSQIGTSTPYPILNTPGKYPSVVNYDAENAPTTSERNEGGKLGTLTVNIQMGSGGAVFGPPTGATITTSQLTLNITDKDPTHFNFNYYKVQLPYYNDVGSKNYNGNRVVTGWKIVSITGGTSGSYTTGDDATIDEDGNITATPYNFADRNCTDKDLYSVSGRVFSQGAYWDVPEGVTAITIEPYWAMAAYVADAYPDVVYNGSMGTAYNVPNVGGGQKYTNGSNYNIAGEQQKVFTTINDAVTNADGLNKPTSNTVNDYAVVLVGNVHQYTGSNNAIGGSYIYTVTTIDLDHDNEPDYSLMFRNDGRNQLHPVKWDFLNIVGLGMAQKATGGTGSYNLGIPQPIGWFESTNTSLFRVTQFEYDRSNRGAAPLILQGGVMEQWVSGQSSGANNQTTYFHVGGNVWFKEFHRGCHQDSQLNSKHPPVSVTGGDYDEFYLTGLYKAVATNDDNAECYINGGRFGIVAGTGLEGIGDATNHTNGNIIWQIQNADIHEFYGGGINAASPMQGSITTVITGSYVATFCGGPKFGDMQSGKTVTTTATDCTFGTYFGAGYGGNSYSRQAPFNYTNVEQVSWNRWIKGEVKNENDGKYNGYKQEYRKENYNRGIFEGVSTAFNYQFLPMSNNGNNVGRLFIEYVKFSLATTRDVTSTLNGCTITGNFYGGGSLGKVDGPVTSTLTDCMVSGNVFGAGYSATLPTVEADDLNGFSVEPYYYTALGTYRKGVKGPTTTFTWAHSDVVNSTATAIDKTNHILYTTEDLTTLGTVTGLATLNINGTTSVAGDVYGGGEMSGVGGSIIVNMNGGTVSGSVYGGGAKANTNTNNVTAGYGTESETISTTDTYTTTINLHGGTVITDVYGGGLGVLPVGEDAGVEATVYGDVLVELNKASTDACVVKGAIFGCNNLNGTPKGNVVVHIYRTKGYPGHWRTGYDSTGNPQYADDSDELLALFEDVDDSHHSYELAAVYGGGNLAAYIPVKALSDDETEAALAFAHVIIDGCGLTSIRQVYGGGNAASAPSTQVDINGAYEIEEVFGGGNGKDKITKDGGLTYIDNPGANVGYYEYDDNDPDAATQVLREENFAYGSGRANMLIHGGRIHRVYGGSNTKGNVRKVALTLLEDETGCPFKVDEAYGGGKSALMDGRAVLEMACIPGLKNAYGGAEAANINNDVELNITNGHFNRVFGGNNISGSITGTITINVEETGCHLLTIGQLYGGGNQAPYVAPEGEHGPTLNVHSFTSIGDIFGGGYGKTAVVTGDTYVNVNVCNGNTFPESEGWDATKLATEEAETAAYTGNKTFTFVEYQRTSNGGFVIDEDTGERLKDNRTVEVYLPPFTHGKIGAINNIYGGGNEAPVVGNTHVFIGTKEGDDISFETPTNAPLTKTVVGADIRGNVFGGGNNADVTGNTNIVIGKSTTIP